MSTDTTKENPSVLDSILVEGRFSQEEDGYDIARQGLSALISQLADQGAVAEKVDKVLIDALIAKIDASVSQQVDVILHHNTFQKMESAWRGLKYVIDHVDFRENIKVDMINMSQEDLANDFDDAPEISKSGLYKVVYTSEYGQFGGEPYGAIVGQYDFTHRGADIKLLQNIAAVSAVSHAPFLAAASPTFFGVDQIDELPNLKDVKAIFEGQLYAKWRSFRSSEDARYVGLTLPKFLLRAPYDPADNPARGFEYKEEVKDHSEYVWGNSAYAMATRLADSFAKYRWCPNIIGPASGGAVEDLPLHHFEFMGETSTKIPTEVLVSDRREFELAEEGFIPLAFRKGSDNAAFFSANSTQMPKNFGISEEGKTSELNYKLGTQLPYMFIICRIAHYLKVLQREQLGSWKESSDLQLELNKWISQYVADQENAPSEVRSRKPLRQASVKVSPISGEPGWYRVDMLVRPHFKYMGADITLSLAGRIENTADQG
jgi:type VI secretion system protein ImpC